MRGEANRGLAEHRCSKPAHAIAENVKGLPGIECETGCAHGPRPGTSYMIALPRCGVNRTIGSNL